MSDAKHTPGEWVWDEPGNWHGLSARVMVREPYGLIATVQVSGWKPRSMALANAQLIAAAPDLLSACKAMREAASNDNRGMRDACDMADAAILKATKGI